MENDMTTRITITSDFLCPWCYLAEARLLKVIDECGDAVDVELAWRPFELNPNMPEEGMGRKEYRSRKFGWERSQMMDAQLEAIGKADGLAFDFSSINRAPNTRLAHRLLTFTERNGQATNYARKVFQAYFERGLDIGSPQVLMDIIESLGLERSAAEQYLNSGKGLADVIAAEQAAAHEGISGVPRIQIGNYLINGAQAASVMKEALLLAAGRPKASAISGIDGEKPEIRSSR